MKQCEGYDRRRQFAGAHPGQFPLGSELSRAAARAILDARAAEAAKVCDELVVTNMSTALALSADACIRILDDCSFLPKTGTRVVRLDRIPTDLNAEETEKFLREKGEEICSGLSGQATTLAYQKAL